MNAKLLVFFFTFITSFMLEAAPLPPEFTATYEVKKGPLSIGKAVRSLEKQNDQWVYISSSKTTGFIGSLFPENITQTTRFEFKDGLIRPLTYHYNRNKGKKVVVQKYDWQKNQVISESGDNLYIYDIPEKVQDQSIYQLSLMLDLASGKRDFTYHVAENVRLMDYKIDYQGTETIKSELGKTETEVVQITTKNNKTTIWSAPKYHYLPIKIQFEEDGTSFMAELTELKGF